MTCWNCGERGHQMAQCTAPPDEGMTKPKERVENECRICHQKNKHLSINCPKRAEEKKMHMGNLGYLQNPQCVSGTVPGLIHEECHIENVWIRAITDSRAAVSVITREFAYNVYKNEAVWREGASNLLSLHGFGTKVSIYETYFAAKVKAFDTIFDQVFFIVDKEAHSVLLGLPALMAAHIHLLTIEGRDVMPDMNKVLSLSFQHSWYQLKAVQSLHCLAQMMILIQKKWTRPWLGKS